MANGRKEIRNEILARNVEEVHAQSPELGEVHDLGKRGIHSCLGNEGEGVAVWQLTSSLDNGLTSSQGSSQGKGKSERHWTQVFCEDVVEKL